ncbi:hypothetical protein [Halocynthiibacter namhaensis]|uniref:hypothetical protein n=1 Tax=Halocynthiibacter namhaensis TaxID=1290553 RepID=UPI000578F5F8|nr:hypothetical protein [Halocynthiibacter namhaensis]
MAETIDFDELTFGPGALPLAFLDFFEIKGAEDLREVMLAVFRSPLGEALQAREATTWQTAMPQRIDVS